jgi:hypothetical protein
MKIPGYGPDVMYQNFPGHPYHSTKTFQLGFSILFAGFHTSKKNRIVQNCAENDK